MPDRDSALDGPRPFGVRPRAVLLDAGFTLTFINHDRVAALAAAAGVTVAAEALLAAEPVIRRELTTFGWAVTPTSPPSSRSGGPAFYHRLLELAGAGGPPEQLARAAAAIWDGHLARNVWSRVGAGVDSALGRLGAAGIAMAVVSNSEGTVEAMLAEIGLGRHFATVVDSWHVGVAKPDPRIFHIALDRLGVGAADAIMLGDTPAADVAGARAAGVTPALLDPLGLHPDAGVPRFPDLPAFVRAVLQD